MNIAYYQNFVNKWLIATLVLTMCLNSFSLSGQKRQILDSLLSILDKTNSDDAISVEAYEHIIEYHGNQDNDEQVLVFLDKIKEYSEEEDSELAILKYWHLSGNRLAQKGKYDEAMEAFNLALPIAMKIKDGKTQSEVLSGISIIFARRGLYDTARTMSGRAIDIGYTIENARAIIKGLMARGNTEQMAGNFMKALDSYFSVDSVFQNSEYQNSNDHGKILINMGLIYNGLLGDIEKAKEYLTAALDLSPKISDRLYYSTVGRLGNLWVRENEFQKADSLFKIAIDGLQKLEIGRDLAMSMMYYGESKIKQGDHSTGLQLLLEAKERFVALSDLSGQRLANRRLANYYLEKEQFAKSEMHLKEVLKFSTSPTQRVAVLKDIAMVAAKQKKFEAAYDSLLVHTELLDSLYESQFQSDMSELEKKFQTAQKEKEIVELKLIQEQQASSNQKMILWGIIALITLMSATLFYYYRSRQKTRRNQQLTELDNLKSKLFSDISHEFRTPLSLIAGPIEVIAEKVADLPNIEHELNIVRRNTSKLNRLVDSVQNLTKLDAGKLKLQIKPGFLRDHLKIIGASFESMAAIKELSFVVDLDLPDQTYYYDPEHLETIVYNLLSNAIKYTHSGEIRLSANRHDDHSIISVSDSGVGLSEKEQKKIFKRFHRVASKKHSVEGVGIGLALTYELTKLHQGKIEVQSKESVGSQFSVTVPTNKEFYESKGYQIGNQFIPIRTDEVSYKKTNIIGSDLAENGKPLLLIVEDNLDMRQHLQSLFRDDYSVLLSKDGKNGFIKASEEIPDIIISDLMMPIMDGQSLLKAIKTDPRTSHIPFVMLTANHLERAKLKGLEHRVDDFLTKPFSIDEIKLKVKNHILLREQLRSKYQNSKEEGISEYQQVNETEQMFWNQLNAVVKQNLNNSDFSADDFAKAMFMSRMQLHRKLKALTGFSTTRYLRNERLKTAHIMLCTNDLTIANVAYEVGFTSPSFFSQSFKEKYGVAPKLVVRSK